MKKIIDLELAREFLNEPFEEPRASSKKVAAAEKKKTKELREKYPVQIAIAFRQPWWDLTKI